METEAIAEQIEALAQEPTPCIFASLVTPSGATVDVSYRNFANIINRAALWLDEQIPRSESSSTFAYTGTTDLRRMALVVAAAKSGRKILLVRRYATSEQWEHLIRTTNCSAFLHEPGDELVNGGVSTPDGMDVRKHFTLPPWTLWLAGSGDVSYTLSKPWKETIDDPVCVFHTSGTTGKPKPIVWSNRRMSAYARLDNMAKELQLKRKRVCSTFVTSHVGGLAFSLFWAVYSETINVMASDGIPKTPRETMDLVERGKADVLIAQPFLLTDMASSPDTLRRVRRLSCIFTGSAPMSKADAAVLQDNGGPYVLNIYGATETLPLDQTLVDRDDWPYVSFREASGVSFEHEQDDLYELIVAQRPSGPNCQENRLEPYRSRDLFSAHPSEQGLWRFVCRKDDLLSLASGQGLNVGPMEEIIAQCPLVDTAIIGEDGRPCTVLLVIPRAPLLDEKDIERARKELGTFVERANNACHPAAAIADDKILFLPTRDRLQSVTEKGTVNRRKTLQDFHRQIDLLY